MLKLYPELGEKRANILYSKIWKLLIDYRTKNKYGFKKGYKENYKKDKAEREATI